MSDVALRKESVDRNVGAALASKENPTSLSARRAWIEISRRSASSSTSRVALRKESVDRNPGFLVGCINRAGRSPQGERG